MVVVAARRNEARIGAQIASAHRRVRAGHVDIRHSWLVAIVPALGVGRLVGMPVERHKLAVAGQFTQLPVACRPVGVTKLQNVILRGARVDIAALVLKEASTLSLGNHGWI